MELKQEPSDNPGWYITINLEGTECEGKAFKDKIVERSEHDWFHCFIRDKKFEGPCAPLNLPEVLKIFHNWVKEDKQALFLVNIR